MDITKLFGVPLPAAILILYLIIMNIVGFFAMAIDKAKARKRKWRVREKTLITISAIGGSIGCLIGMDLFRHKTNHKKFYVGIPVILLAQIVVAIIILKVAVFS